MKLPFGSKALPSAPESGAPGSAAGKPPRNFLTPFAALKNPDYRTLWLSMVGSFSAIQMQTVARGWLTAELTGNSAIALGSVGLALGLPQIMFALFGGGLRGPVR